MHEYSKRAIDAILHEANPLSIGKELEELEKIARMEVDNESRLNFKDSGLSNLQVLLKNGPLKPSYASGNKDCIKKADKLIDNLDDQSFTDVLVDTQNP